MRFGSTKLFTKKYIRFGQYAAFTAGVVHALFFIIFQILEITPLAFVNIFSITIYALCLKELSTSIKTNDYTLIGWLVYIELMGHAIIASIYVGTYSGFHYYIILLSAVPFLTFSDSKTVKILKVTLIISVFVFLEIGLENYTPIFVIEESYLTDLRFFNVSAFVSCTIIISLIYAQLTFEIRQQLEYASTTDQLTGLYNRRLFIHLAEIELSTIQRRSSYLSLILLDVDNFKKINDQYGHKCGDEALTHVADILRQTVRPNDILSRWGGEEFIVLLPNTDIESAALVAERLRLGIATQTFECEGKNYNLTVTLGLTANNDRGETLDDLIEQADHALYLGKAYGKNQYVISNQT
jgi:diguanylate cyclase (GGDEF)-like protein